MKRPSGNIYVLLCTLLCLFFSSQSYSQQTLTQINGWNAYVHLPASYSSSSTSYPTIIFFPGVGEVGTNAGAVISNGPGAYISQGWNGNVVVDGNTVEFIVISLQPVAAYPTEAMINEKIQTIKSLYRVNTNKLYLTGLSQGGWCSTTYVTGDAYGGPYTYASQIAAVVEVEGVIPDDNAPYPNLFDNFALSGGHLLSFEQALDNRGMPSRVNRMNATKANSAIYVQTNFGGGGHCCWSEFYGGGGTQPGNWNLDGVNQNLYQWLARQSKGGAVTPPVNTPPTANAGSDQTITLPASTATLSGSGADANGSISSYAWTKVSGPTGGNITSATSASTGVTGLIQGVYTYQLKVTDNGGATATDNMIITVNAATNTPPTANAGVDQIITLPASTATLSGSGTDVGGSISAFSWTKVSGPTGGTITSATSASSTVTALTQGTYTYQLKVTDNLGLTATDNVIITVNAATATIPTANAGADQTVTLPTSTANLNGSGTVVGGTISSYQWSKVSGPTGGTISNGATSATSLTALTQGSYTYQLKVTDNKGVTATDNINLVVNAAAVVPSGNCNANAPVTYYITQTAPGEIYRPNGSSWKGGDTVKITGTSYSVIEFNNVGGDACRPLVIMPMTTVSTPVFRIKGNAHYIKVWGGPTQYGIKVTNGTMGVTNSNHIEVNNVEAYGASTGVYCKQDVDYSDRTTWATATNTMTKIIFRNMWIHDTHGEGMYVGITAPDGMTVKSTVSGKDTVIVPIRLDSVEISNCLVERTDWDGIQLSNARNGCQIFNNTVRNYGLLNISSQQAGIILGGNTTGDIYNNKITKGTGNGIEAFGYGVINIYGNTLDSCGIDGHTNPNGTSGQHSLYVSDYITKVEVNPKQTVNIYSNAVNHPPTAGGIRVTGDFSNSYPSSVYNNTFCIPNAPTNWLGIYVLASVAGTSSTNNTQSCSGPTNAAPKANAGVDVVKVLPANSSTISGSGTDTDGSIASYQWKKVSGPTTGLIVSPTAASTIINGLAQGVYLFELQVTDNSGAIGKDTMQFTVNNTANATPAANAGTAQTISLPTSQLTLTGSGTDADGTIASYQWYQLSGTGGVITSPNAATTTVTGLTQGSYQYQLKVTDNLGATATALVNVTVNAATTTSTGKAIRVNVYGGTAPTTDVKWNNWNLNSGLTSSSFLYEDRTASAVSAKITGDVQLADNGQNYAPASTTPTSEILRYNSFSTSYRILVLKGLSPAKKYRFEFYASRKNKGNKSVYALGNLSDTISTDNNVNDYAKFDGIVPDKSGNVTIIISRIGTYNYIAGFSIIEQGASAIAAKIGSQPVSQSAIAADINADPKIAAFAPEASVYPNPFNDAFKVQIKDMAAGTYSFVLSDITGKTILTKTVVKSSGPATENVQTNNIPAGVYILQVINANGTKTAYKLIKN